MLLVVLLGVGIVVDVLSMISGIRRVDLVDRLIVDPASVTSAQAERSDVIAERFLWIQIGLFVVTAVVFVVWFVRAYDNAKARLTYGMRYSRAWAIWGWFVPIVGLFRPKQIMNDIWRASMPVRGDVPTVAGVVHLWWAAYLLSGFVARLQSGASDGSLESLRTATNASIAADVVFVVSGVLAIVVVIRLTKAQNERG